MTLKNLTRNIIIGIAALCLMAYAAIQISLSVGNLLEVENAVYSTSNKTIPANAYIFRDEDPVLAAGEGSPCYFYADGEKVFKNAEILKIYSLEKDAEIQEEINALNKKITLLEKSSITKTYSTTDLEALDSSIASKIFNIITAVGGGSLDLASLNEDDLLILMNRRSAVITAAGGYDYIIDTYKNKIAQLNLMLSGSSSVVTTGQTGYFYSTTDGYENIFTMNLLNNLTMEDYFSLETKMPDDTLIARSKGKLVTSVKWYITVCLDKRTIFRLTEGKPESYKYEIKFPYSDNKTIKMKLEKVVSQTDYDNAVLVFSSDVQTEGFNYTRMQPVEIVYEYYEGLKIPSAAIRVVDGITGVYTLDGNVVKFKKATVLNEENGYCICRLPYQEDINKLSSTSLSLYDPVIVAGIGLYEGKIIK